MKSFAEKISLLLESLKNIDNKIIPYLLIYFITIRL